MLPLCLDPLGPEQPRAGRSLVGRGCGGRGGGGKGVTAAAAGQVRPGRGRRRGGAGLRPGPRLSAPSRLRSSGRWSGRRRAGPGGGGGRAEDSSLTHPTCLSAPPPPLPNHRLPSCRCRSTRSCGPGQCGDHSSLAPARAPAPSAAAAAAAASSASPRRRAHDGAVLPLPHASACHAPPRGLRGPYSCGAAEQLERPGCRWAGTAARAGERGRGAGDVTALPSFSRSSGLAARPLGRATNERPNPGTEPGHGASCPGPGDWTEV